MSARPILHVEYLITADDPTGAPVPPADDAFYALVSRTDGQSRWRRLHLHQIKPDSALLPPPSRPDRGVKS